jgi:signal transduction histidine kinase
MTTPFAVTLEHLASRLADQRVALAATWLEQLDRMLPVDARDVFPTPTLLDHIPDLIAHIALYVQAPDAEELDANAAMMQKATELGLLRFDQRASVSQLLREYHVFSEILDRFLAVEAAELGPEGDAMAAVVVVSRTQRAVRVLQQRTIDVLVASYTDRIERKTAQLRSFSQLVSHEIRQPLGVLQVLARMMQSPAEINDRMGETLERNVVRLGEVADKLERMARLTRPRDGSPRGPVTLSRVVATVVAQLQDVADNVAFEVDEPLPVLDADEGRVELVLANLLSNAVKYRDVGKPRSVVRVTGTTSASHALVQVEDNGIGIPAGKLQVVFDHFTRAHAHLDEEMGTSGLGLGLALVRESMEAMGGTVTVESTEGQGTTFTLAWPNGTAHPGPPG